MEATTLSKLPGAILDEIFKGEHSSFLVVTLWKCGDSLLNNKLARDITYIDLKDTQTQFASSFPTMLSRLSSLRTLRIDRGSFKLMPPKGDLATQLSMLTTSGLEIFKISSSDSTALFRAFIGSGGPKTPIKSLVGSFDALRSLSLPNSLPANAIPDLPPNLTFLEAPGFDITLASAPIFSALPKHLETWHGQFNISPMDGQNVIKDAELVRSALQRIFADPPPHLSTIFCIMTKSKPFDYWPSNVGFSYIPRTINVAEGLYRLDCLTMDELRTIPPVTTKIIISGLSEEWKSHPPQPAEWMALLPLHLERLEFEGQPIPFSLEFLRHLPRSLKKLTTSGLSALRELRWCDEMKAPGFWPPGLTDLALYCEGITTEAIACLPASISTFWWHLDEKNVAFLPNLKTLTLNVSQNEIVFYPQSVLDHAAASHVEQGLPGKFDLDSASLPGDSLETLHLFFSYAMPFNLDNDFLPRRLKKLSLHRFRMDWFEKLPRTLTFFSCSDLRNLPIFNDSTEPRDYFSALPSGLVELMLRNDEIEKRSRWPALCFSSLPHLKELLCYDLGWFDTEVLANLPIIKRLIIDITSFSDKTASFAKTRGSFGARILFRSKEAYDREE